MSDGSCEMKLLWIGLPVTGAALETAQRKAIMLARVWGCILMVEVFVDLELEEDKCEWKWKWKCKREM